MADGTQLEALVQLRASGVLTEKEYRAACGRVPPTPEQEDSVAALERLNRAGIIFDGELVTLKARVLNQTTTGDTIAVDEPTVVEGD